MFEGLTRLLLAETVLAGAGMEREAVAAWCARHGVAPETAVAALADWRGELPPERAFALLLLAPPAFRPSVLRVAARAWLRADWRPPYASDAERKEYARAVAVAKVEQEVGLEDTWRVPPHTLQLLRGVPAEAARRALHGGGGRIFR